MPAASSTESLCIHRIEPSLGGPLPRKVPITPAIGALVACTAVFWSACAGIGIFALLGAMQVVWLHYRGQTVPAHVRAVVFEDGRRGASTLEPLSRVAGIVYDYRAGDAGVHQGVATLSIPGRSQGQVWNCGASAADSEKMDADRSERVRRAISGQPLLVRYARWGGGVICEPGAKPSLGKAVFLVILGSFVSGIGTFFAVRLLRWLGTRASLMGRGIATIGTIVHKRADAEDVPKFFLRYGYAAAGVNYDREEQCSASQWRLFEVGESVTILYDANEPPQAALYRLLPFHQSERKAGSSAA